MSAILLEGAPVGNAIRKETATLIRALSKKMITPCIAVIRIGDEPDQLYYENILLQSAEKAGINVRRIILRQNIPQKEYESVIAQIDKDPSVHGILPMRPLPDSLDPFPAFSRISLEKDIDGCSVQSLGILFSGSGQSFAPCTAQAVLDLLHYYEIPVSGKRIVIVGRSLVVGKPLSQLLLKENATVTVCHSRSECLPEIARNAEILVACVGKPEMFTREFLSSGQIVLDVGINWIETEKRFCGDVRFIDAESICHAITPVPGGVGAVTTARLLYNAVFAAVSLSAIPHSEF